jgi:hypothetical protein
LLELSQAGCANICIEVPDSAPFTSFLAGQEITPPVCHASPTFKGALVHDNTLVPEGTTEDYPAPEGVIEDSACNALNLGVEFFLLFSHQIRALLSFLFPRLLFLPNFKPV